MPKGRVRKLCVNIKEIKKELAKKEHDRYDSRHENLPLNIRVSNTSIPRS
jgi:hypothetical protein